MENFLTKPSGKKIEKYDFYQNDFFKHHSCSKLYADFNAKKNVFNFSQYILSYNQKYGISLIAK